MALPGIIVPVPDVELVCVECHHRSDSDTRGWQAHLVARDDDEDEDEVVCFCPACAEREFGELRRHRLDPPAL